MELKSDKTMKQPLKIVMLSDLHLGYHNTRADLAKWVELVNAEHADAVLIGGDIVDFSVQPLLKADMAAEFRKLKDRKSTRLNSSHANISYAVFCLKKK